MRKRDCDACRHENGHPTGGGTKLIIVLIAALVVYGLIHGAL